VHVVDRWTGRRAMALCAALRMTSEEFAQKLGAAPRTVSYWESRPASKPSPLLQAALDTLLDRASEASRLRFDLLSFEQHQHPDGRAPGSESVTILGTVAESACGEIGEVFMVAAHESANDAILRAAEVGPDSLGQLHDQVLRVARCYSTRAPIEVFGTARRLRDVAQQLAERCRRPNELADLYVISGEANALMASIAFDLGHWDAAVTLAQSASTYADLSAHSSLLAWTLGLRASLANWRNRPAEALRHFEQAQAIAPAGAPRLRVRYIAARTHALRGDAESAAAVLELARADRDVAADQPDVLQDEIRGEFRFDDARAAACAAAAWLALGDGDQAEQYAIEALAQYAMLPAAVQPFSPMAGARIDTVAARLLQHDLACADEALRPVLALEPARRNAAIAGRLGNVAHQLAEPHWRSDPAAEQLAESVTEWLADTAAAPRLLSR